MSAAPFRIVYQRSDGQRFYFDREVESRDQFNVPRSQPHFGDDARLARKFHTPIEAIGRRDAFRSAWPRETFFIESINGNGERLYEDRTAEVTRTEAPADERQNWTMGGILIRPASLNRWCVKFPNTNFESLYSDSGGTVEDVYQKLTTFAAHLIPFAERFTPPELSDEQFAAQIEETKRVIQQARFPGRRRPGNPS